MSLHTKQEYILEMKNIHKSFPGVQALNDVSFKVRPGTVHALMGENGAGKSTLMKCLFGIYKCDSGEIVLNGQRADFHGTLDAINHGIAMIHQELHPEPHMSVMENVWLGRFPVKGMVVDFAKMARDTKELLRKLKVDISPYTLVKNLSVSQTQSIEIVKAVSYNANIIIMDEPTSSLTREETDRLFEIINDLRDEGSSIIYISHKIDEIKRISDEISIMRDGRMVGTWNANDISNDKIISNMVGRDLSNRFPPRKRAPGEILMEVEDFTSIHDRSFQHVSFTLRKGEVLGIGGLVGAQRTELIEAIFGLRAIKSGKITLNGKEVTIKDPSDAMDNRLALLTEDRKNSGLFHILSVAENVYIASYKRLARLFGFIDRKQCNEIAKRSVKQLGVKTPSLKTPINFLSGGNQQKVLIARWLEIAPDILLLDEPTRGIDVGAKYEIYKIMEDLVESKKSIIFISSEMPELIGMSDRVMVMCEGRKIGELSDDDITEENIMRLATNFIA